VDRECWIGGATLEFFGGDVDLGYAYPRGPLWRLAKVQDPVQPGTHEKDDVCTCEGGGAGGGGVEWVIIREDTFPLRGWEEGDFSPIAFVSPTNPSIGD